jgi:3-hydroxyacyl-CoA dehydrogenase / enoyl-CoA hydratase / 3-hydroxybutyryl-CoA epimerase
MTMSYEHFRVTIDDRSVATVLIDRADESMNTLSVSLLTELDEVVNRLERDDVRAVVIGSAKEDFLAGADIRMFADFTDRTDAVDALRRIHALFARIEALHRDLRKPVVAAINGACLGGGLELALCASLRLCSSNERTQFGQPEVQLGLIPGVGGTQRLPEVIGLAAALEMIVGGRPVRPHKARSLGLVDEITPPEALLTVARTRAFEAIDDGPHERVIALDLSKRNLQAIALEKNRAGRRLLFKKASDAMEKATGGHYPAPRKAIEVIRTGAENGREAGFDAEIDAFTDLVFSPESAALRSIFFASQATKSDTGISGDAVAEVIEHVAVLGGGLMGGGIAAVSALETTATVRIKEVDAAGVGRGLGHVRRALTDRAKRRRMSEFEVDQIGYRVTGSSTWKGFAATDIVIEAVFEDLDLKRRMVQEVESVTGLDTIFASNTSSIPIASIAEASARPENVIGMHYFSPVEKMPLLEVITTEATADRVTATTVAFGKAQGKTVIVVNDGPGFYTTRILAPYANEAAFLLADGASVEAIDGAMTSWGFPVGPLLLADEVGLDVGAHITDILTDAFGERMRGPATMAGLLADDRKGRKNGRGFYTYENGERGRVDETVYDALGLPTERTPMAPAEIQNRLVMAFVNEAARCLEEGVLRSARDGDIGAVFGLGYPPFRGGPFWTIDALGAAVVVERLESLEATHGTRFRPAKILVAHAASGEPFRG